MNAYANITIRVVSAQAMAQMRAMRGEMAAMDRQVMRSAGPMRRMEQGFAAMMTSGTKAGNQLQWTGRQLQYNFSMPLALAGGAAIKFALDNEKAMTRVIKVYGDGSEQMEALSKTEIPALSRAFRALSDRFGVAQADAINIAADWAAAGASGLALAKSVKLTMETMILGELEAVDATQQLIAIQAQYGLTIDELSKKIDVLNMVENQTGISMKGLMEGMARAAGVARSAGVDVEHLAAMMAALVPAAGTAANAGNALKTIISRLLSPTGEAAEVMGLMGIRLGDLGWKSLNASQRLEIMAKKFEGLSDAQKAVVSSVVASRWQINRFDVLMRDIINTNGYYQKSLRATSDEVANYNQRQRELNAVLSSNPQRVKQIWVMLQNAMADVIQPLIPALVYLGSVVARLATAFSHMDPAVQKLVGAFLLFFLVFGPLVRYMGSSITLMATMGHFFKFLLTPVTALTGALWALTGAPVVWFLSTVAGAIASLLMMPITALGARLTALMGMSMTAAGTAAATGFAAGFRGIIAFTQAIILGNLALVRASMPIFNAILFASGMAMAAIWTGTLAMFAPITAAWATMFGPFFAGIWIGLGALMAEAGAVIKEIWLSILFAIRYMTAVFTGLMSALWAAWLIGGQAGIIAARAGFASAWASVLFILRYLTMTFSQQMIVIFEILWATLQTMMMALPRIFALAWMGVVAVMQGAAFAMGFIAAGMYTLMVTIFTAPARLLPILSAGMSAAVTVFTAATSAMVMISRAFIPLMLSPWTWLILAIIGLAWHFRDQLRSIWEQVLETFNSMTQGFASSFAPLVDFFNDGVSYINKAFMRLPEGVRDAMMGVIKIVHAAAMAVYDLFSYFNPFARHSPSLVESVEAGMGAINGMYASTVRNIGGLFAKVNRDLGAFKRIASSMNAGEWDKERGNVAEHFGGALPIFDALVGDLGLLKSALAAQDAAVSKQQAVVDRWGAALKKANSALDAQEKILDKLQDNLTSLQAEYDAHEESMQNFGRTPIKGMGEMSDKIFENEMAQKRLRLEMMKYEDSNGSIDSVRKRLALLQGDIEKGHSEVNDLRLSGAGSDITGPLMDQVKAMEAQRNALEKQVGDGSPVKKMEEELDRLKREGERLDLENSIKFDPLLRQIEKAMNAVAEMSFEEIIAGINRERQAMEALKPQIDAATEAVDRQQKVVDDLTDARDALQAVYDVEAEKLELLKDGYNNIEDAVQAVTGALRDMSSAAADAAAASRVAKPEALSPGAQNFLDAAGGNFPEVGGFAQIGREGGMTDQSAEIDAFTQGIAADTAAMFGDFDMWKPIKDMWKATWGWISENIMPTVTAIWERIKEVFSQVGNPFESMGGGAKEGIAGVLTKGADIVQSVWGAVFGVLKGFWRLFGDDIMRIWNGLIGGLILAWNELGPAVSAFFPLILPLFEALWNVIKIVVGVLLLLLLPAINVIVGVISHTFAPVLDFLIRTLANMLDFLRGVVMVFIGLFTGDWQMMVDGILTIIGAWWDQLKNIFQSAGEILWGIVKGIADGIWDTLKFFAEIAVTVISAMWDGIKGLFQDAYDVLPGPVQKLVDIIIGYFKFLFNAVETVVKLMWAAFKWQFENVLKPVVGLIGALFKAMGEGFEWVWNNLIKPVFGFIVDVFKGLGTAVKFVWENVVQPIWDLWWGTIKRVWQTIGLVVLIAIAAALAVLGAAFEAIWNNVIKPAWNALVTGLKWAWDHIGRPVIDAIGGALSATGKWFQDIWNNTIKPAWNSFVTGIKDGWNATGGPLFSAIGGVVNELGRVIHDFWHVTVKGAWKAFMEGLGNLWEKYGKGGVNKIIGGINAVTGAINTLFKGLNAVGTKLGIGLQIDLIPEIPKLAVGGYIPTAHVGAGFKTRGARAIVGEGNSNYPEYVIPTDPRYRDRASALYSKLGSDIGMIPMHAWGTDKLGEMAGGVKNLAGGAVDKAQAALDRGLDAASAIGGAVRKGAVMAAFAPFLKGYDMAMGAAGLEGPVRDIANQKKNDFYNWAKGESDKYDAKFVLEGGGFGRSTGPWPAVNRNGFSANAAAAAAFVRATFGVNNIGGFARRNIAGTNQVSDHALGKAIDVMISNYKSDDGVALGNAIANWFTQNPQAFGTKYVIWRDQITTGSGWREYNHPGGDNDTLQHRDHVHVSLLEEGGRIPLARGGITQGPTRALIGEAGPEAVIPLSVLWQHLDTGFASMILAVNSSDYNQAQRAVVKEYADKIRHDELVLLLRTGNEALVGMDQRIVGGFTELPAAMVAAVTPFFTERFTALTEATTSASTATQERLGTISESINGLGSSINSGLVGVSDGIRAVEAAVGRVESAILSMATTPPPTPSGPMPPMPTPPSGPLPSVPSNPGPKGPPGKVWVPNPINKPGPSGFWRDPVGGLTQLPSKPPQISDAAWKYLTPTQQVSIGKLLPTLPRYANGGWVKASAGGQLVVAGDGGEDELIIPKSRIVATSKSSGSRTINLYGDLVLPNIRSGEDAEDLIRNLESLAD